MSKIEIETPLGDPVGKIRVIERQPEYLSILERVPEAALHRLRSLIGTASDATMGTPVGRMMIRGEFKLGREAPNATQSRYDAANWFFGLYHGFQRAVGSKTIAPQSYEVGSKGEPVDPFSEAGERLSRKEKRITREFQSAKLSGLSVGAEKYGYFLAVVIEEQEPNYIMKQAVVQVCEALRRHRQASSRHRQGRRA